MDSIPKKMDSNWLNAFENNFLCANRIHFFVMKRDKNGGEYDIEHENPEKIGANSRSKKNCIQKSTLIFIWFLFDLSAK